MGAAGEDDKTVDNHRSLVLGCARVNARRIINDEHERTSMRYAWQILRSLVAAFPAANVDLAAAIRRRFAIFGGIELELPTRDAIRHAPDLAE